MDKIKLSCFHLIYLILCLISNVKLFPTKSPEILSPNSTENFQQSSSSSSSLASLSSCPNSCYCDQDNLYVSCVGDDQWDSNLPLLPITVTRLEIKNYNLSSSSSSSNLNLSNLKSLQEVKLNSLNLISLSNETFNNLIHLERLDLSNNKLTTLNVGVFSSATSILKFVDLSSNRLQSIYETFNGCNSIEHLNLRSNQLTNITINTFIGLVKLVYLNLDGNLITTIELGSFLQLTRLGHLIISNNPISMSTRFDSLSTKLKYVDVSNISLTSIPHGIDPFIRDLRLSGNAISKISSGDFDNYLYLNVLVLDSNGLSIVELDSLGRLEYLIELWAKDNQLTSLPIDLPPSLRKMYLSHNQLTTINSTIFSPLVKLERLDLSNNLITTIETDSLSNLVNLVRLNLSNNKLTNLVNVKWPSNLKCLDLSANPIVIIDLISLTSTPNLEELNLSKIVSSSSTSSSQLTETINCTDVHLNHLKKLDLEQSYNLAEQFMTIVDCNINHNYQRVNLIASNLTELNLLGTGLKSLGNFVGNKNLLQIEQLTFDSQQLDCSLEDNQQLSLWLKSAKLTIKPSSEVIKCESPQQLKGLPLIKLHDHLNIKLINNNQLALSPITTSKSANNDDETSTIMPKGLTQVNLSSSSSMSSSSHHYLDTKLNHSKDYASGDLHLNQTNINNNDDDDHHHLIIVNGNISITNGKHDKPTSSSSSSGHQVVVTSFSSHDDNHHASDYGSPQILSNNRTDKVDYLPSGEIKVSSDNNIKTMSMNNHDNLSSSSSLNQSNQNDNIEGKQSSSHKLHSTTIKPDNKSIINETINNPSRLSENFKRSIIQKSSSSSSSSSVPLISLSTSSSSSGLLLLPSSSSSLSSYQTLPSLSTASLSSSSSSSSHLASYGIVSFIIGSLIITTMLCFAILTMIKSRKIYTSIVKDTRVDNRSWLHRSVSYLSQTDEVSFLSLTDTIDLSNNVNGSGGRGRLSGLSGLR
ncbi:serine-rich adhesin for platelets-like [Panonychus citri]|uniref:serine-rich adhesin for platelets-like n=1 Tax=Panonychus citri TaxID=50023 RepID=UPI002307F2F0|nr:serine-rich adhesin for platelets-like [Panonychus citri]